MPLTNENKRERVLIVDDEEQNALLIEDFLSPLGLEIYKAYDGARGVRLARIIRPDVILLDIHMPEMDGIEACRQLKEDKAMADAPVLFITALNDALTHVRAIRTGGHAFITKPIQRDQLLAYVTQALQKRRRDKETWTGVQTAVSMLTHDMLNLMQVNHGCAQLLLCSENLPKEVTDCAEMIRQATEEMMVMANAMLDLEKKELTGLHPEPQRFSLGELVHQRAVYSSVTAQGRELKLEMPSFNDHSTEKDEIVTDREMMARVLDNLLLNAVKFCPQGGAVTVHLQKENKEWRVQICNDGKPIPLEWQERIFEPFSQKNGQASSGRKGMGLGLTFCRMAVETLGGKIGVHSPLPHREDGVCFEVTLPEILTTPGSNGKNNHEMAGV
ncbi:MAG: hybrid sensor histidine kinase/response regulator [bacterium]